MGFPLRKTIIQKGTGKPVPQIAGVSQRKKAKRVFSAARIKRVNPDPTRKDFFKINKNYFGMVNRLAEKVRDKKSGREALKILFVCPEGYGFSASTRENFNRLATELGVSDIVTSYNSRLLLDEIPHEVRGKIDYIVPRHNDQIKEIKQNLWKAGDKVPKILKNNALLMARIYDPLSYKKFMLQILKEIISSKRKPFSKKVISTRGF